MTTTIFDILRHMEVERTPVYYRWVMPKGLAEPNISHLEPFFMMLMVDPGPGEDKETLTAWITLPPDVFNMIEETLGDDATSATSEDCD